MSPQGLLSALRGWFPQFGDGELLNEVETGEANLHTVMREFSSFDFTSGTERQLTGLAALRRECVAETDLLENACGTCFLEHLRQIDKRKALWNVLPAEVQAYVRAL